MEVSSEWYLKNKEVKNATKVVMVIILSRIGQAFNFDNHLSAYPNLNTVELSASVKEIGASAFSNVATLLSINLESVENIGNSAFGHTGIESVTFDKSLVSIGNYAFYYCGALKQVNAKGTVSIGESSFEQCRQLASFLCDQVFQ